ncbi:MAG: uracil-DNA glycosylase [Vicingaceae bacterium]|nr:uracil-DNA glycosylase [Vicingaceae bacterium]
MNVILSPSWKKLLSSEINAPYFADLLHFLADEKKNHRIFPPEKEIFNAFNLTPLEKIKVVIIGQDPYHGVSQAHGLCFSVNDGVKFPPSLKNIFKELQSDLEIPIPLSGNLTHWAEQGVFLLNNTLTVREKTPTSHQKKGWEEFTDAVIKLISEQNSGVIFLLWGSFAQSKENLIDTTKHLILKAAHPSPFSAHRGFLGCQHFSKSNEILKKQGLKKIDWKID